MDDLGVTYISRNLHILSNLLLHLHCTQSITSVSQLDPQGIGQVAMPVAHLPLGFVKSLTFLAEKSGETCLGETYPAALRRSIAKVML